MSKRKSRREFLKDASIASAGIALGATAFSSNSYSRIKGANERINFAIVGLHNRGIAHLGALAEIKDAYVNHICDVDERELDQFSARVQEVYGEKAKRETDFRKLIESKDIDAITICTPEHWHTHMAIMGMQAGKHIYLEKPSSHNPAEGELLVKAQKKYGKLVQLGTQQRSSPHTIEAIQKINEGIIGRVYFSKTWYSSLRGSIGVGKIIPVPDYLNWDLWQGPAPRKPYKDNIHPYNWHWFWHWGTGEHLNNGTHEIDLSLWALDAKYPQKITAAGGRYHFQDDWEFYDTIVTSFEYEDKMITWEGVSCQGKKFFDRYRGTTLQGTEGTVLIDRNGYIVFDRGTKVIEEFEAEGKEDQVNTLGAGPMTVYHFQNFIKALKMGEKLNSPIDVGNISITILLLANISWKVGRTLKINPANGHIIDDREAEEMWSREYEPGWELKI